MQIGHVGPSRAAGGQPHADRPRLGDVVQAGPRLDHVHDGALRLHAEQQVQVREAQVGVHGDDPQPRRGQVHGEVAGQDGLAGAPLAAGDADHDGARQDAARAVPDETQSG